MDTVTFATTRFTSSSYEQWEKIYLSYEALIQAFIENRENLADEETKYQVRGRDYVIDLCGTLDALKPAVTLMVRCQAVNLPPWKIVGWFPVITESLTTIEKSLEDMLLTGGKPNENLLPRLSKHWDELSREKAEDCLFLTTPLLEGWLVVGQEKVEERLESGQTTVSTMYNWSARTPTECIEDLILLCRELKNGLQIKPLR